MKQSNLCKSSRASHAPLSSGTALERDFSFLNHCHKPFPTKIWGCFSLQTNPNSSVFGGTPMKSFSKFSAVVALLCDICQMFVLKVFVRFFTVSHESKCPSSSLHISSSSSSCCFLLSSTCSTWRNNSLRVSSSASEYV